MLSIEELLPLLEGIRHSLITKENFTLEPGKQYKWEAENPGWLTLVAGGFSTPYAEIEHSIWVNPIVYYPYIIYTYGFTTRSPAYNWIVRYDTTNNVYVMVYEPRPYKGYKAGSYIAIRNPKLHPITKEPVTTSMTVYYLMISYIELYDREAFVKSLRELIGMESEER